MQNLFRCKQRNAVLKHARAHTSRETIVRSRFGLTFGSVFIFFAGGGLAAVSIASSAGVVSGGAGTAATLVCSGLAGAPAAVALAGLGGGQGAAALVAGGPGPCDTEKPVLELGGGPWVCCGAVAASVGP
ncbi:hypothetical protein PUN28_016756 [Cardiocondyla obscurior]|uniref:Uncharacterized protein n=1 Tax=Cardiocondyla obscurior TaxID=286306 RepID=A0AAW2EST8_9HYME